MELDFYRCKGKLTMKIHRITTLAILLILIAFSPVTAQEDQDQRLFLPLIQSDSESIVSSHDKGIDGIPTLNVDELQPCPDGWNEELSNHDWTANGEPDYDAPGCILQGGVEVEAAWGRDEVEDGAGNPSSAPTATPVYSIVPSSQDTWFTPRKVVLQRLDCSGDCLTHITGIQGVLTHMTGFKATLADQYNQHVAYWFSIGTSGTTNCSGGGGNQRVHIGIGIGNGKVTPSLVSPNPSLFYDYFVAGTCTQTLYTSISVPTGSALAMKVYATSYSGTNSTWAGAVWANGQWNFLFTNKHLYNPVASYIMLGAEMGSANSNFSNIDVPLGFHHKVDLTTQNDNYPWNVLVLPSPLNDYNMSWFQIDSPWALIDGVDGEYTSLAWITY